MSSERDELFGAIRGGLAALWRIAAIGLAIGAASLLVSPSWVAVLEAALDHGFDIEMVMRVHFAYGAGLAGLVLLWFAASPGRSPAARFTAAALMVEIVVLLGIWTLDRGSAFTREHSALTWWSSVTLVLVSLAAFANGRAVRREPDAQPRAGTFWALVAAAFAYAALDEQFTIHERIGVALEPLGAGLGLSGDVVNDLVTVGYFLGAVGFAGIFFGYLRSELRRGGAFAQLFALAIGLYGLAVANDSLDVVVQRIAPATDPQHVMNFAEEVLELSAAVIFLSAFVSRLLERGHLATFVEPGRGGAEARLALARVASIAALAAVGAVSAAALVWIRPPAPDALRLGPNGFEMVADARAGLRDVHGMAFDDELGLLVASGEGGVILALNGDGPASAMAPESGLGRPAAVASAGRILYTTDSERQRVERWSPDGGPATEVSHGWVEPTGLAVDGAGRLFVADRGLSAVFEVESSGARMVASSLDGLMEPGQLALGERGDVYVADPAAGVVFRIRRDSTVDSFVGPQEGLRKPTGVAFRDGQLYVADAGTVRVHRFDRYGRGSAIIEFARQHRDLGALTFDDEGRLYIAVGSNYGPNNFVFRASDT